MKASASPIQREQFRIAVLRALDAAPELGMSADALLPGLRIAGWDTTPEEIDREAEYLADPAKGLVTISPRSISPEVRRWRLTANGRDELARLGLA